MGDFAKAASETSIVRALLIGGPSDIPDRARTQMAGPRDEKIKIPHYGGYEHFARADLFDHDNTPDQVIYRWTMRTEMAE
jgi:hypothetical protein